MAVFLKIEDVRSFTASTIFLSRVDTKTVKVFDSAPSPLREHYQILLQTQSPILFEHDVFRGYAIFNLVNPVIP